MSRMLSTVDFATGTNSSGSNNGIGRATKKVRIRPEIQLEIDDSTVDINGQKIYPEIPKASYKSTFLGASLEKEQNGFMEEDFTLLEGDVVTKVIEGVPSITFSNRVKDYIQCRMAKTIIMKLLGGRLGLMYY